MLNLKLYALVVAAATAGGFYIDHRARSQVHETYRIALLERVQAQREQDILAEKERTRIDNANFELIVYLQGLAGSARASEQRVRNKLNSLSVSCDPSTSAGCEAAISLAGLLERSIEKYRELGERSGRAFAEGKKCEGYYEEVETQKD